VQPWTEGLFLWALPLESKTRVQAVQKELQGAPGGGLTGTNSTVLAGECDRAELLPQTGSQNDCVVLDGGSM
jgi:hypothetical protein